jgi:hypothetical protein
MPLSRLVPRFGRAIEVLLKFTPYELARRIRRDRDMWRFNDRWVFGWFVVSAGAYVLSGYAIPNALAFAIAAAGASRMWEITLYSLQAVFFVRERTGGAPAVPTVRRVALLSFVNFAEIVLWFALYYRFLLAVHGVEASDPAGLVILHHSLVEMVANSGGVKMITPAAWTVSIVHIVLGLFMTLVVVARVVSMLPRPLSLDPLERDAETASRD